jgi:hypothetical protein
VPEVPDSSIAYQLRALLIVEGFRATSVYPVPLDAIHAVAYFTDAFAPLWRTEALSENVLKTREVPRDRQLQDGIDRLVGRGVLLPSAVTYIQEASGSRLSASYSVNSTLAARVLAVARADAQWAIEENLTREIAIAAASLGHDRIARTVLADASYSNPLLDFNTVVYLDPDEGDISRTTDANDRLAEVAREVLGHSLSPTEITGLYMRHLYPFTEASA